MKKNLFALGILMSAVSSSAFAADAILSEPVPVAPAPLPVSDWTGFYVGGHLGWAWDDADWTFTNDSSWGLAGSGATFDLNGVVVGGQAGYMYQFQNDFVLGADVSASYTDLNGSISDPGLRGGTDTFGVEVDWLLLAQGRIGYAFDQFLIFAQGGYAGADATATARFVGGIFDATSSDSNWHNGWTIGGGFSYKATESISFGGEYNYVDLQSEDYTLPHPVNVPPGVADIDHQMHVVKFTVNFHFGGN